MSIWKMDSTPSTSYWRPGNALAALGILILRLSAKLPLPCSTAIGKGIGTLAAFLFPYRKRIALTNFRLCFPEMSDQEHRKLLLRHYQAMGMGIFELAASWWKTDEELLKNVTIEGLEHLDAVAESGRGALLMTGHFTTMEIIGRLLISKRQFSALYRNPNQPVIAKVMAEVRSTLMKRMIHFDQVNDLIRALREGDFVWYAPDQGKRLKYSALIPFFGVPAVTNTATGRIARMGKAAIIPYFGYRKPDGHYHVKVYPALQDVPSNDPEADALKINHLLEDFIRKAPDQYFWLHKRFKRRPGLEDAYKKS